MLQYKGYKGEVEIDFEGNIIHGRLVGLQHDMVTFEGRTPEEVERAFRDSIDDYLKLCEEEGDEPERSVDDTVAYSITSEQLSGEASAVKEKE